MDRVIVLLSIFILGACSSGDSTPETNSTESLSLESVEALPTPSHPGEANFNLLCAHCHGYEGQGQIEASIENTRRLGMKTVPAHDSTGHTWQHATPLLIEVIQEGIDNPLNHYVMSGFGNVLTEGEILDIIDYMRQWWTEEQREYQAEVTRNYIEANGE